MEFAGRTIFCTGYPSLKKAFSLDPLSLRKVFQGKRKQGVKDHRFEKISSPILHLETKAQKGKWVCLKPGRMLSELPKLEFPTPGPSRLHFFFFFLLAQLFCKLESAFVVATYVMSGG